MLAPSVTARLTGIEFTMPPSMKCSPSMGTGGRMPGTAHDARTTSASGPLSNQCSAARSIDAATHWKGIDSSSTRSTGSTALSRSRISVSDCRCVPVRARVVTRRSTVPGDRSARFAVRHSSVSRSTPASVGSAAKNAPLIAPTEVPRMTSGWTPLSARARSMPTSWAPRTPPPPRTNATSQTGRSGAMPRTARPGRPRRAAPGTQVRRSGRR